jgi:hypothetical protein
LHLTIPADLLNSHPKAVIAATPSNPVCATKTLACHNLTELPLNAKKLLSRVASGHVRNVAFRGIQSLVEAFQFHLERTEGSHHIYSLARIAEQLNLQAVGGEAKPYQIRQFLRLVERYDLRMEEEA